MKILSANHFSSLVCLLLLSLSFTTGCSADQAPAEAQDPAPESAAQEAGNDLETAAVASTSEPPTQVPASNEEPLPEEAVTVAQAQPASTSAAPATRPDAPAPYRVGDHYSVLSPAQPTSVEPGKVEVTEFFMYTCPHCYNFQPFVEKWAPGKPANVELVRVPALFNRPARIHARVFYTAETLGVLEEVHMPFFRELHVNRKAMTDEDELVAFFANHNIDEQTFRQTYNSFAVDTKLRRAEALARRYRVTSTPTVIVNGKYVIDGDKIRSYGEILDAASYLAKKELSGS